MTRAPDLLRDYLADRDVPCERCTYNLRGVTTVQCPECGLVIPRPPADFVARSRSDPASLRLFCEDCGYTLSGTNAPRCPECGSPALSRYTGDAPPRIRRRKRLPLFTIFFCSGPSLIVLFTCIVAAYARAAGRRGTGNPWNGALLSLIPLFIAGAWLWWRVPLARLEPGERKALAAISIIIGIACLAIALRTLA